MYCTARVKRRDPSLRFVTRDEHPERMLVLPHEEGGSAHHRQPHQGSSAHPGVQSTDYTPSGVEIAPSLPNGFRLTHRNSLQVIAGTHYLKRQGGCGSSGKLSY